MEFLNEKPIGVFDSGVGGLSVLCNLQQALPNENFVYFGDTKNIPYGSKSKQELLPLVNNILTFFHSKNTKAVIMACNTTSATVYEELATTFDFELYPLIQVSAKKISALLSSKTAVLATQATINSHKYKTELQKYNKNLDVTEFSCPGWVQIVENETYNDKHSLEIIQSKFAPVIEQNCKNVILGCTHFPYLTPILKTLSSNINFIDPAKIFTEEIKNDLMSKQLLNFSEKGSTEFFVSANPTQFESASKIFLNLEQKPTLINI